MVVSYGYVLGKVTALTSDPAYPAIYYGDIGPKLFGTGLQSAQCLAMRFLTVI